jgi:hypothetical protein
LYSALTQALGQNFLRAEKNDQLVVLTKTGARGEKDEHQCSVRNGSAALYT